MMTLKRPCYTQTAVPVGAVIRPGYAPGAAKYRLGFFLFVLVNAAAFMRPSEIWPDEMHPQTYLYLILACLAVSFLCLRESLTRRALAAQPITVCVLGLLTAIVMSHLTNFDFDTAYTAGWEFSKIVLYYLLFLGLVRTPTRLCRLLLWLVCFVLVHALVAVLQYHRLIHAPYFEPLAEEAGVNPITGPNYLLRLCGSGIFHNPNEFCYPVSAAMIICLYYLDRRRSLMIRVFCLAALLFFGYAISLTHSRGGFVGLLAGLLTFLFARYGWRKALPVAALVLPVLFVLFGGRQTDLDIESGTGQTRIQMWNDGLVFLVRNPLFGIGTGQYRGAAGLVAHNSFIQAYGETGFFGGTLFVGAFYCAALTLYRLGSREETIADDQLRRLRPYLMGLVGGHIGAMISMSLTDMIPTYTILAIVAAYLRVTPLRPPLPNLPRFNGGLALRLVAVSVLTVATFYAYVRLNFHIG
jgi:O-antigen ligase